jgi:transcriptional regulator with XRE-family HTH domain
MNKKELYKAARDAGETYDAIAKRFGVSRQAVWSNLNGKRKPWQDITLAECIYPNLRGWMNDNRVSVPELAERVTGDRDSGANVRKWIAGSANPNKKNIDKMLSVTGLTYEEMFAEEQNRVVDV